jgi:hypothetical protein
MLGSLEDTLIMSKEIPGVLPAWILLTFMLAQAMNYELSQGMGRPYKKV